MGYGDLLYGAGAYGGEIAILSRIEFAFGADLTSSPATWTWTDVSLYALGSVRVSSGRADEASQTQPTSCTFRLRNTDARFSPRFPTSPYYPNVRRQTPVRVSLNPGTGYVQRFQGYVDVFTPTWPSGNASYAEVTVTASGVLRRLGRGSSPIRSALYRAISQAGPVAYWPLEDGENSTQASSGLLGGTPMILTAGKVTFASASGLPSSAPLADFSTGGVGGQMSGVVPPGTSTTAWRVEFVTKFNALPAASFTAAVQWFTGGSVDLWEIDAADLSGGGLYLQYITAAGAFGGPFLSNVKVDDGLWHHIRIDASQSGGNIALTVKLDGTTVISQTLAALTMGQVTKVLVNPTGDPSESVPSIGHVAVWAPFSSSVDTVTAWRGNAGETAGARIVRLCTENNVPAAVSSTTGTTLMGPQTVATLLTLLRECEAADGGILYDGASAGISYLARQDRYNLPVALALDCVLAQVKLPFLPTEDDQRVRNDWTVRQTNGSWGRYKDAQHIAANGLYDDSTTINIYSPAGLTDQASWRVNLDTVEEMRVPGLSLQLIDHPELWASWLSTTLGERLTAVNLPTQYPPPGTLDMILEGATEVWDAVSWRVDLNTSPFAPWRVIVLAADSGDTGAFLGHLDTDDSGLGAAITTTATSILVRTNSGPLWTTAADDYPFALNVGGEQITATAAAAAVTDTFTRLVTGSWGTANSGQTWTHPMGTSADFAVVGSTQGRIITNAINQLYYSVLDTLSADHTVQVTMLGVPTPTGAPITIRVDGRWTDSSNYYEAELAISTAGSVTLILTKRVAGVRTAVTSGVTVGSHSSGDAWTIILNVTGSALSARAWNASTGSDPGGWQVTGTDASLTSGTLAGAGCRRETGNTNGVVNVDWDNFSVPNPQTFTATRSINGVVKAHLANASVSLWAPLVLAL